MPLSIAHLSFSRVGGAGSVAAVLSEAQRAAGDDSQHEFAIESTLWSRPLSAPLHAVAAGLDHYILRDKDFEAPISLARDALHWKLNVALEDMDIIHLHNVNGLTRIGALARAFPNKKIVWTLHDMNPFTGACHYALECSNYTQGCSQCPAVTSLFQGLVERSFHDKKIDLDEVENLHLVAPSEWMGKAAKSSQLMSKFPRTIINNPLDPIFFDVDANTASPTYTFVVVAQNLEDPVKNVSAAVHAFGVVKEEFPRATMALVGRGGSAFSGDGIHLVGPQEHQELAGTLQTSEAIIVPSTAENAPMVIAEAASQGCLPIVRDVGGMSEMITKLGSGHSFRSSLELTSVMAGVASKRARPSQRQALRSKAQSLYSVEAVRKQYDKVYGR